MDIWIAERLRLINEGCTIHRFNLITGAYIVSQPKHGKNELQTNISHAMHYYNRGEKVVLLDRDDNNPSPDAQISSLPGPVEFKSVKKYSANTIQQDIRNAKNQARNVSVKLLQDAHAKDITLAISRSIYNKYAIDNLHIISYRGNIIELSKQDLEDGSYIKIIKNNFK